MSELIEVAMDGSRRLRLWALYGGVLFAAVGCTRNTQPDAAGLLRPAQPTKSMWGGASPSAAQAAAATESADAAPARRAGSGKGLLPETEVQFANTHVEVALNDPPPANRDELLDLARARYQRALKQDPKNKGALLGMSRMYARLGDRDRAAESYRAYLAAYPKDVEVVHEMALAHARWGDWANAVSYCEAALKADPENRTYCKTMGFCLARAGRWDEGLAALVRVMPEAQARYNIARVLEHQNKADASRQQLVAALQVDPNYMPAREFLVELDQAAQPGRPGVPTAQDANPIRQVSGFNVQQ